MYEQSYCLISECSRINARNILFAECDPDKSNLLVTDWLFKQLNFCNHKRTYTNVAGDDLRSVLVRAISPAESIALQKPFDGGRKTSMFLF